MLKIKEKIEILTGVISYNQTCQEDFSHSEEAVKGGKMLSVLFSAETSLRNTMKQMIETVYDASK